MGRLTSTGPSSLSASPSLVSKTPPRSTPTSATPSSKISSTPSPLSMPLFSLLRTASLVPSEQEIKDRIEEMLQYLKPEQLWIDPDCGLKTRQWSETKAALTNMVNAAKFYRQKYAK